MVYRNKILVAALSTAASFLAVQSSSHAQVFTEATDAGQTLLTADATAIGVSSTPLTTIVGTFNAATDADVYVIDITAPGTFSASTVNTVTDRGGQDTALFLFNAKGNAVATNDDAAGGLTTDSALPAGNALYANLAAGIYYLGISQSGNEPVNTANQLLFQPYPGGDTTAVRGAATGLNPTTEATFNGNDSDGGTGAYEIDLTSTESAFNPNAVPEPSTWAAFAVGSIAAAFTFLRRRHAA